jgi:hypothetical protein
LIRKNLKKKPKGKRRAEKITFITHRIAVSNRLLFEIIPSIHEKREKESYKY